MTGRLNTFQRTMRQWDELHPYNAVHVGRVRLPFSATGVRTAVDRTIAARGVGRLTLDPRRPLFAYASAPVTCELRVIHATTNPDAVLATEVEQQINTRFITGDKFTPVRFFAVPTNDGFWLGLAYFHVIADADSVVRLLCEIVGRINGETDPPDSASATLQPARIPLGRRLGPLLRRTLRLPRDVQAMRRVRRPPLVNAADLSSRFEFLPLGTPALAALLAAAKRCEVTVNDLLLALLLRAIAPPEARRRGRRRDLAVGCIVNTRPGLGVDSARTFGLHLGAFTVTHAVPDGTGLAALARDVAAQTRRIKRGRLYAGNAVDLALAQWFMRFSSTDRRAGFYHKSHPLWGGVTNMNLNALWPDSKGGPFTDYFRAVSNGPATPLVLSVTTCGDHLNAGLSWRPAVFPDEAIARFRGTFLAELDQLAASA